MANKKTVQLHRPVIHADHDTNIITFPLASLTLGPEVLSKVPQVVVLEPRTHLVLWRVPPQPHEEGEQEEAYYHGSPSYRHRDLQNNVTVLGDKH